jgi:hypothetical protein
MRSTHRTRAYRGFARLAMTLIASAAIATPGLADPPLTTQTGTIPSGTKLRFHLNAPLASDRNRAGDTFSFALLDPVVLDGHVLVPSGAIGNGTVLVCGHNGTLGHEGDLTLRLDDLALADAQTVRFTDQQFEINGGNRKAESRILGIIPDVGIAALFIRGKDVHVDTTTPIQTVLLHPATLVENVAAPSPNPAPTQLLLRPSANINSSVPLRSVIRRVDESWEEQPLSLRASLHFRRVSLLTA